MLILKNIMLNTFRRKHKLLNSLKMTHNLMHSGNSQKFKDCIKFLNLVGNLKHTKRTGWLLRNVPDPESIASHMYRMAIMSFLLNKNESINAEKVMKMALVHDLGEAITGDFTPHCNISKEKKKKLELDAMETICELVGNESGSEIMTLFQEYEELETDEAKFVKDLDYLDMILQAFEYEKRDNKPKSLQEFFDSTEGKIKHPFIINLVNEIKEQRTNFISTESSEAK